MNKMSFEEALAQLECAAKALESGELSLDSAIAKYEEAIKYAAICNERLASAERKVKLLQEGQDGSISDRPFDENEA